MKQKSKNFCRIILFKKVTTSFCRWGATVIEPIQGEGLFLTINSLGVPGTYSFHQPQKNEKVSWSGIVIW